MSRRDGLRDRWRDDHVIPHRDIGDACKVLLLVLAARMTNAGYVSVPRRDLADLLGVHPQRIAERIATAVEHDLLMKTGGGYAGRTAEYTAVIPTGKGTAGQYSIDAESVRVSGTHSAKKRTGERYGQAVRIPAGMGTAERYTNTRALVTATEERTEEKTTNTNGAVRCIDCGTPNPYMAIAGRCRTCQTTWLRLRRHERTQRDAGLDASGSPR